MARTKKARNRPARCARSSSTPNSRYLGEAARITHNATGEGIYQAMQSGAFAADAVSRVLEGGQLDL